MKINWLLTITLKKYFKPNRLTISASNISFEKNYFIVKYKVLLIIPMSRKIFYKDVLHYKSILRRKNILNQETFEKISNKKITKEKKKEIKKILFFKLLIIFLILFIVGLSSFLIALLII